VQQRKCARKLLFGESTGIVYEFKESQKRLNKKDTYVLSRTHTHTHHALSFSHTHTHTMQSISPPHTPLMQFLSLSLTKETHTSIHDCINSRNKLFFFFGKSNLKTTHSQETKNPHAPQETHAFHRQHLFEQAILAVKGKTEKNTHTYSC